ncbi:hypothetical protein MGG_16487 [Pyricularia oryzae 70-15]|uniref:Uncharacterized protein n=3 Tax=Pyricularia TaxID=48558 RepID=A0A6P8AM57_PYRGI|nr:uncharacterized protein MGG_16487 [Pyricularia oryzae 70-15]XP_030975987.1 uncharacterized protein PgNI_12532 [Pyricularia grisea]KAI6554622.1 hypothetical protein MCOR04_010531 [Pyricularia oryzae]EHA58145.1 hypothetical protein MGG_16487 [Pyricularia oryzae 70-15]KAI6639478.1 hypothetical protein MCOR14_003865 [Pyricularia oryzae]KAI7908382.1 hypothetical protein M0657_012313 [Pyricularia oryzae]QBZ53310.1 hypothetical protein PoMZ_08986 [Pyricularia oryzae]
MDELTSIEELKRQLREAEQRAGVFRAIVERLTVPSRIRMDLALASRFCQWLLLLAYTCRTSSSVGITESSAANIGSEEDERHADEPEPHFEPLSPFGETH